MKLKRAVTTLKDTVLVLLALTVCVLWAAVYFPYALVRFFFFQMDVKKQP